MRKSGARKIAKAVMLAVLIGAGGPASCTRPDSGTVAPADPGPSVSAAACEFGDTTAPGYVTATPGYVPDDACAECHSEIYDRYQHLGMANSFSLPSPERWIEDFRNNHFYHEPSDRHYEMIKRGDDVFQRRYQLDEQGNRYNELEMKVEAIIGSGNHVRTYLYRDESDELFQMPLAWYTSTQSWGMNPGYDLPRHEGFTRQITRNCMFCHNAYPEVPEGSDEFWQPQIFPAKLPEGLGCQRCHGPGAEHVAVANRYDATERELRESIVNPGRLEPARRDDVCFQCHLQPSSRFASQLLRFDRPEYSFRPGQPLEDYLLHVDIESPDGVDRFEINHHPYRLRQSRCYLESGGALNCLTCHDPHGKPAPEDRAAHYQAACLSCHAIEQCDLSAMGEVDADADCVSCHMPTRRTEDVVQATMTDHRIVARPAPESERLAALTEVGPNLGRSDPEPYFPDVSIGAEELALQRGIAVAHLPGAQGVARLKTEIEVSGTTKLAPLAELATAQVANEDYAGARETLERLVELYPEHGRVHTELGLVLNALGDAQGAVTHLTKAIESGRAIPEAYMGLGSAHYALGDYDRAIEYLELAIEKRSIYPVALLNLGIVHQVLERWEDSSLMLTRALQANPDQPLAQWYLGIARYTLGDVDGAITAWTRGARLDPSNPRLFEANAMTLLMRGAYGEALRAAQDGYRVNADEASLLYIAAIAQQRLGNRAVAPRALQSANMAARQSPGRLFVRDILARQAQKIFGGP